MSAEQKMKDRQQLDRKAEDALGIRRHDPLNDHLTRYSPSDIEAIENERVPWLAERRKRARRG